MTRRATNESPGYMAACKVAEPLNIPRIGAKVVRGAIGKPILIRQSICCDFAGTIRGTGRMFVCDFKRNDGVNVFPISENFLAPHQKMELIRHGNQGAIAGLLIESSKRSRNYWCDWTLLHRPESSIPFSDMIDLGPASAVADLSVVFTPACAGKDER